MRRLAWVVASLALHAGGALAATSLGHASARRGASAMTELSVETEPAPVPVPPPQAVGPEEPSAVAPLRPAHASQAHIHSYPVPRSHDEQPHDPGLLHVPRPSNATPAARPAEAAVAAPADAPALPKFSLAIVPVAGRAGAQASGGGAGPAAGPEGAPLLESAVSRGARLVSRAGVQYPAEARAAEVEATVAGQLGYVENVPRHADGLTPVDAHLACSKHPSFSVDSSPLKPAILVVALPRPKES